MIKLTHVYKTYDDSQQALNDITFHIVKGEFVWLSGPSGAGKTTLLRLLFAAEKATLGQVVVNGHRLTSIPKRSIPHLRRTIGVVFQDFKLLTNRTVAENVAVTLEVQGRSMNDVRQRVRRMLRLVCLDHRQTSYPRSLSGGEQQRVAIARALVGDPAILLADEPTGNLDAETTKDIMQLLATANARGTTVMVATHDHNLMAQHPRRAIILERGRVVGDG